MKNILFPNDENYLVVLTGISYNNCPGRSKETNFSSRMNQFTKSETLIKYAPSFSEVEALMEYKQFPDSEAGRKEVENLEVLLKASKSKKLNTSKANKPVTWFAASTVILIIAITALIHYIKIRELNSIYKSSFILPSVNSIHNTNFPLNLQWDQALAAFKQKKYPNTIDRLSLLESDLIYGEHAAFLKGICLMQESQYSQAISLFESIKSSSSIYTQAKWNIGLCYLKLNRINAARLIFLDLTISEEWGKNAKEILLKLESID